MELNVKDYQQMKRSFRIGYLHTKLKNLGVMLSHCIPSLNQLKIKEILQGPKQKAFFRLSSSSLTCMETLL